MVVSGRTTPSTASRRDSLPATPSSAQNTTSVKVVLRIRPTSNSDHASSVPQRFQRVAIHSQNSTTLQIDQPATAHAGATASSAANSQGAKQATYTFDRVVSPEEGQPAVYECAKSLVDSFMKGMNSTILAYGQTSSGKSYTMGTDRPEEDFDLLPDERLGITPRAVMEIFDRMKEIEAGARGGVRFEARVSYVEIYNEDLIDLLAGDLDVRPAVQIREDKAGNIIWSGLREVKVSSAAEVMSNLTAGSALRQTNATDMNAQSSRSHAIFSLTLTQRKYTGAGSPPPSTASSPQRIRSRVTSPTPGSRSATPTSDRPGSRFGLRPQSTIGRATSPLPPDEDKATNGAESWVVVTSKFHFVDLAGSERLKRTSAQGDRVKEGISINSGLHALGNVISALGDPSRARQTTHIPYRDSKLTRLLQDSLGGNAQTMMVACVSPTEFNLNETLSTVKYANRARNIKNRAEVNEVEVGWDDVDYLQKTILRLRSEMGALKNGEAGGETMAKIDEEGGEGKLDEKYAGLTATVAHLRAELASLKSPGSPSSQNGSSSATTLTRDDFAKAVEPIVEEYEKSLSALESQLSLTKAALAHSEEEMRELGSRIEDDARTIEASTNLVTDLKARIVKLSEREATTEAYVRDLEAKLKDFGDEDESHGTAVSDLRKEITRNREQAESTEQYIKELEGRLAKSDELSTALKRQIDVLERDVVRREEAYRELEGRLSLLDTSGEHKALLAELDERDKKLLDLERTLDEVKSQAYTAEQEAARLQIVADAEKEAKEELQSRVRTLERASISAKIRPISFTPPQTPAECETSSEDPLTSAATVPSDAAFVAGLEKRVGELQAAHDRTLGELEIANARYRESLKEIEDLNSQVQEAKLIHLEDSDTLPVPPSPSYTETTIEELTDTEHPSDLPSSMNTKRLSLVTTPTSNRTSPRSRRSMPLAPQHRLSFLGRGPGVQSSHTHLRSASLSQELSLAQGLLSSSSTSPSSPRPLSPSNYRDSIFGSPPTERSYDSLKREVMKLQEVLSEREGEISALEATLHQFRGRSSSTSSGDSPVTADGSPPRIVTSGLVTPPRRESPTDSLPPKTRAVCDALKQELLQSNIQDSSMRNGGEGEGDGDASIRLDNLMRAMAKKESAHRETIEDLEDQLTTLRRHHDELTVLSRDQVLNMAGEIEKLRSSLDSRPEASHYEDRLKGMQSDLTTKKAELEESRRKADEDLESIKLSIAEEHLRAIDALETAHATTLLQIKEEHADELRRQLDERKELLAQKETQHTEVLQSQSAEHAEALRLQALGHDVSLQGKAAEMEEALRRKGDEHLHASTTEHTRMLSELASQHDAALSSLLDGHASQIDNLTKSYLTTVEQLEAGHAAILATQHEAHEAARSDLSQQHELAMAARSFELQLLHEGVVAALVSQHADALASLATSHEQATGTVKNEHVQLLTDQHASHTNAISKLHLAHAEQLREITADRDSAVASHRSLWSKHEGLQTELSETKQALDTIKADQEGLLEQFGALHESHDSLSEAHAKEVNELRESLAAAIARYELLAKDPAQEQGELGEALDALSTLEKALLESQDERDKLLQQVADLRLSAEANRIPVNGAYLPNGKPPPPTPPPSMPPPPLPAGNTGPPSRGMRSSSGSSVSPSLGTSRNSNMVESPASSIRPMSSDSVSVDPRLTKKLEEQDAQISRLQKQLDHCEEDLRANVDLVNTLESALNDSERNLRKARNQMGDLARERDTFLGQNDALRRERQEKDEEVAALQASVEELEHGLRKEREWKRQEEQKRNLVDGLGAVNESKRSKFACF